MLELKDIVIEDKKWIDPFVIAEATESADFCFGNMYLWNIGLGLKTGTSFGRLILRIYRGEVPFFAFPIGNGPLAPVIEEMKELAEAEGCPLIIAGITEKHREMMEKEMPGLFQYKAEMDFSDYIYKAEMLASLAGRKLHGKRNHINKFLSLYPDWHFEELKKEHFEECKALFFKWRQEKQSLESINELDEEDALKRAFDHYDELGITGGVLYAEGKICAFTMGEKCAPHVFLVHFEKADKKIEGAYPMVNREFVRMVTKKHPEVTMINRAEDMGIESLRKAKHSYRPFEQVIKYTGTLIEDIK